MPQQAHLADGTVLEFPDDTPQDVMDRTVRAHVANPENDSAVKGFIGGALKPLDNLSSFAVAEVPGFKQLDELGTKMGFISVADAVSMNDAARAANHNAVAQFAGNVAGTLPTAYLPGGVFAQGAASGAALSDSHDAKGVALDTLVGGLGSKVVGAGTKAIGGVIAPQMTKGLQALHDAGVVLTPGQILSASKNRLVRGVAGVEDALQSTFGLGDMITGAKDMARDSFNGALGNRVLGNINQKLPGGVEAGDDMVNYARTKVGDTYDALVPNLSMKFDPQFVNDLAAAKNVVNTVPTKIQNQFEAIVRDAFGNRGSGTGMFGTSLKNAESFLTKKMRTYAPQGGDHGVLAEAVGGVRQALRDSIARANPQFAPELQALNKAWAQLRPWRMATDANNGLAPTAKQVAAATRRGGFNGDDLVKSAAQTMGQRVADSGTAKRTAATIMAGAPTAALAAAAHPTIALPLLLAAAYTKSGVKAANKLAFAPRGPIANAVGDTTRWIGNHAGSFIPALFGQ